MDADNDDFISTETLSRAQIMTYQNQYHQAYDRGHHIFDAKCFCGKMLMSYQAEYDHYHMKHPRLFRKMKKQNVWEQLQYDWRVHPDQAKISRNNSSLTPVSNK